MGEIDASQHCHLGPIHRGRMIADYVHFYDRFREGFRAPQPLQILLWGLRPGAPAGEPTHNHGDEDVTNGVSRRRWWRRPLLRKVHTWLQDRFVSGMLVGLTAAQFTELCAAFVVRFVRAFTVAPVGGLVVRVPPVGLLSCCLNRSPMNCCRWVHGNSGNTRLPLQAA